MTSYEVDIDGKVLQFENRSPKHAAQAAIRHRSIDDPKALARMDRVPVSVRNTDDDTYHHFVAQVQDSVWLVKESGDCGCG